jgi:hypothetical protein
VFEAVAVGAAVYAVAYVLFVLAAAIAYDARRGREK